MLTALRIAGFATLEEVELTVGPGLTVLTGETGAGKSLLVDALGLLLGARGDAGGIRSGVDEACIEGSFTRTPALTRRLEALGLPDLGEEVSVRRVLQRSGRGKVHVNGALVTVGVLSQLLRGLFDIAGQLEQLSLFSPAEHRLLLDRVGSLEAQRAAYADAYRGLREIDARCAELTDDARLPERVELLELQLKELTELAPVAGEDVSLDVDRRRLADSTRLLRGAQECEALLQSEEGAAAERIGRARAVLRELRGSDGSLGPLVDRLEALAAETEDVGRALAHYGHLIEVQPERLAEVEERLARYRRACRKHGTDSAGLVVRKESIARELEQLACRGELREQLEQSRIAAEARVREAGAILSAARRRAARALGDAVSSVLHSLAMPNARFEVQVHAGESIGAEGMDDVQFLFCAHGGETLRPLSKVASGGEASRLLLALRRHLLASDDGMGCVLDEADAGVSGAVADVVGRLMKEVSRERQVLCITHLPQVAAYGDAHWVVEKREEEGRARSTIRLLSNEEARTFELARMLSGQKVSREALGAAQALVRSAGTTKRGTARVTRPVRARRSA